MVSALDMDDIGLLEDASTGVTVTGDMAELQLDEVVVPTPFQSVDWQLRPSIFEKICEHAGWTPETDGCCDNAGLNSLCPDFISE